MDDVTLARDERGIALPMALIALVIVTALIVALSVLTATEPTIASNHLLVAQARGLAESGVERALWALSAGKTSPGAPGTLAYALPALVPAPYDGSLLVPVSAGGRPLGGFRVTVTAGPAANERLVDSTGWAPTDDPGDARNRAHQRVVATLMDFGFAALGMPCALCARGDLRITGGATVDARADASCGNRHGTWSTRIVDSAGATVAAGVTALGAGAAIRGADGNDTPNEPTDLAEQQSQALFDARALTRADLNVLRTYARAAGTYYRGPLTFDGASRLPNGIVFVDTAGGAPAGAPGGPGLASIRGRAAADPSGVFKGWVIVNGGLAVSGDFEAQGLLYAVDAIAFTGAGARVLGQVISQNTGEMVTSIEDDGTSITYDCTAARTGGGSVPQRFIVKPGTYREVPDS
jgi:hypothetical protein